MGLSLADLPQHPQCRLKVVRGKGAQPRGHRRDPLRHAEAVRLLTMSGLDIDAGVLGEV
jgi:hypothetical protein